MFKRKIPALKERPALGEPYSTVSWAVTFGFATALILAGVLYYFFKDELILKRSIAIAPSSLVAPLAGPRIPIVPVPK